MSLALSNDLRLHRLKDRSTMLQESRSFFIQRGFLEVDCPILSDSASIDSHIDLITATYREQQTRYLHSSPEYGMKRLLAEGIGDIFQLSHVFRDGEHGKKHNPEFTLVEWYRVGQTFTQIIEETCEYIRLFLGQVPSTTISYHEAFIHYAGIDYTKMECKDLLQYIQQHNISSYPEIDLADKDDLLNLILADRLEPYLGKGGLTVLTHYPASQAALAKIVEKNGERVAERFEVYYQGKELANGYHELADPIEQKHRFAERNLKREQLGKSPLPSDIRFLEALTSGMPDCCGVAVGFDRLMMLRHHTDEISDILPFGWDEA